MTPTAPNPSAPGAASAATAPARAAIEGQMAMLTRLAEIGMDIAEACGREARAAAAHAAADTALQAGPETDPDAAPDTAAETAVEAAGPSPHHIGLVFARVARAVRMTIALHSRLAKEIAALDRADFVAEDTRKYERRSRLRRLCGQAVEAEVNARPGAGAWTPTQIEDEIESLTSDAYERLKEAEDDERFGRPFDEAVAAICADLGLSPEWTARLRGAARPPPAPAGDQPPSPSSTDASQRRPADPAAPTLDDRLLEVCAAGPPGLRGVAAPPDDDG